MLGAKTFIKKNQVTQSEWPFIMQRSGKMDYYFSEGKGSSKEIKKYLKEAAQSIIDHAEDIVDQYDLLDKLKIEMELDPKEGWVPEIKVTSSFLSERTFPFKKEKGRCSLW